jgi:transcriptional regulator with XRE-family HTH domain
VRRAQRLTIESLAEASGLTKSFLSKVERSRSTPSVAALLRIAEALGIPLSSLFENGATRRVLRSYDYPQVNFGGERLVEYLLTPHAERRLQVLLSKIASGGGSGAELYQLPGDVEFLFLVDGVLEMTFSDGSITLRAGDALTFDPASYRSFRVPDDAGGATVLWVISPALPHTIRRGAPDDGVVDAAGGSLPEARLPG